MPCGLFCSAYLCYQYSLRHITHTSELVEKVDTLVPKIDPSKNYYATDLDRLPAGEYLPTTHVSCEDLLDIIFNTNVLKQGTG